MSDRVVFYHAACTDGFAAAWAAYRKFGTSAEYHPASHSRNESASWLTEILRLSTGKSVYIVDFCFPPVWMLAIAGVASSVVVYDHHVTAINAMSSVEHPNLTKVFDKESSGALITARNLLPQVPPLINYVSDRDLWRFMLPYSKEVNACIMTEEFDFTCWDRMHIEFSVDEFALMGASILRAQAQMVRMADSATFFTKWNDLSIPTINVLHLKSETGAYLLYKHPEAPFVALFNQENLTQRIWSLRARKDSNVNVALICAALSPTGGGHAAAAGFTEEAVNGLLRPTSKFVFDLGSKAN